VPEVALASSDESLRALSVFFAPTRYRVVKITRCSFEVVLRTMKHTMIYPDSDPSLEVLTLHLVV
jgi:hypothetical protein